MEGYGQIGAGPTLGISPLVTGSTKNAARETTDETQYGFALSGAIGVAVGGRSAGVFFAQVGYDYAPTFTNETGETHDSGGFSGQLGFRILFGR